MAASSSSNYETQDRLPLQSLIHTPDPITIELALNEIHHPLHSLIQRLVEALLLPPESNQNQCFKAVYTQFKNRNFTLIAEYKDVLDILVNKKRRTTYTRSSRST